MAERKRLGIVGGMGSVAAAYFFQRLIELTPAETDQEYIETFVHNNTSIPDRTEGIIGDGPSPLPKLQESVRTLNNWGANYLVLACMTSHYFVPELQKASKAVIIDGIAETAIQCEKLGFSKVGVIASTGAVKLSLFQDQLAQRGIEALVLSDQDQVRCFNEPIYQNWGIKAGHITGKPRDLINEGARILVESGAEAIVAGCSELPLVLDDGDLPVPLVDSIDILLNTAIRLCCGDGSTG